MIDEKALDLTFSNFKVPNTNHFKIDIMMEKLLKELLRSNPKFRRVWGINYTPYFIQFLRDKCSLREPVHISIMGFVRSAKSVSGITVGSIIQHFFKKPMTMDNVVENEYVFLDSIKQIGQDSAVVIDESKQSVHGSGSFARQSRIQDVRNIIAVNNISTVNIRPDKFTNESSSSFGLRSFGRCPYLCMRCGSELDLKAGRIEWNAEDNSFKHYPKVCKKCGEEKEFNPRMARFMLYNLMESSRGKFMPEGMVFIPHFSDMLSYGNKLEEEYLLKKQKWVDLEQMGETDVLQNTKLKVAFGLSEDENIKLITKKNERIIYISTKLGSEYTINEIKEIEMMVRLIEKGVITKEEFGN